tara:strand:- start:88 stop:339 length:252 start_codon:yes stop_codon:yes gene_type:complete
LIEQEERTEINSESWINYFHDASESKIDEAIQIRKFQILFSEIKEEILNRAEELKLNLLAEKIKKYSAKLLVSFILVFLLFCE